jgi:hypothetical protein
MACHQWVRIRDKSTVIQCNTTLKVRTLILESIQEWRKGGQAIWEIFCMGATQICLLVGSPMEHLTS